MFANDLTEAEVPNTFLPSCFMTNKACSTKKISMQLQQPQN